MILIILSIFTVFISFFLLYIFSKQDFVLLRQNISLSEIFDAAIVVFLISILAGRILYIVETSNYQLLHLVKFFYITKFPGISILGFFLGGAVAIKFLFRNKKGLRRIYDIFAISALPLFGLFVFLQNSKNIYYVMGAIFIIIISFIFFVKSHQKYILKDGSNALAIIVLICLDVIISQFLRPMHNVFFGFAIAQILSILVLILAGVGIYFTQKSSKT